MPTRRTTEKATEKLLDEILAKRKVRLGGWPSNAWIVSCDKVEFWVDVRFDGKAMTAYAGSIWIEEAKSEVLIPIVVVDNCNVRLNTDQGITRLVVSRVR